MSSWRCPYCNQIATLLESNMSTEAHDFYKANKDGWLRLTSQVIVCPNSKCKEYTLSAYLYGLTRLSSGTLKLTDTRELAVWKLKPQSAAKPLHDYVPKAVRDDYAEACLIAALSPKASATLARRCLQGMIRDFFGVSEKNLYLEIQGIKDRVDSITWDAIDAVRSIGNIGAHMEKDINLIVDVEADEAILLIGLIETLIDEWYVHRHDREARMSKIVAVAAEKNAEKAGLEGTFS